MKKPPSIRALATRAVLLLGGFYVLTIGLVVALVVTPAIVVGVFLSTGKGDQESGKALTMLVFLTWVPAGLMLRGLLRVRRPRFEPPGAQLSREQAPAFFEVLDELSLRAQTAPPREVFLSPRPNLGVTEVDGTFGYGSKRVLILGIPILHLLDARQLRAVLAHELGHYLGGDTKLCGVLSYCEGSFRAVHESMRGNSDQEPDDYIAAGIAFANALGNVVVGGYARLYTLVMRPAARRQELAADALAVRLVGREPTVRGLETLTIFGDMYDAYLHADVARVVAYGAVPSDLMEGFQRLRECLRANGTEAAIAERARTERTAPWDNHPCLAERIEAMNALEDGPVVTDEQPALALFEDRAALDAELIRATGEALRAAKEDAPKPVPWARMAKEVVAPRLVRDARKVADAIGTTYRSAKTLAQVLKAAAREINAYGIEAIAHRLLPKLYKLPHAYQLERGRIRGAAAIAQLLAGALVEDGAEIEMPFLSTEIRIWWNGVPVDTVAIARAAVRGGPGTAQLSALAKELDPTEPEPQSAKGLVF